MTMLPELPVKRAAARLTQTAFAGLDRRAGAGNGAVCDMENLWSGDAPLLSSRPGRYIAGGATKPNGLFSDGEHLFLADGTTLYADGAAVGTLSDTEKVFAALGNRVLIWPDKVMLCPAPASPLPPPPGEAARAQRVTERARAAWVLEPLGSSVTVSATFADGTYAGEAAEGNTILAADTLFDWSDYFSVGDAVTVTGAADPENNKTPIVREIEGNALRFYENTFTVCAAPAAITVAREVPDLDFLCVNDNRVWGCRGDTVRCCALGDPKNWNVFDGLSTDAWSWDSGTAGAFTACVSFLGYPVFFKENAVFKVYGSRPGNYEAMRSAATGVLAGAQKSLAVAGDVLYYLSPAGFMAYSGGMPSPIGEALQRQYSAAVGGSDGEKYFVSGSYASPSPLPPLKGEVAPLSPLPPPPGEVAERSEAGEGPPGASPRPREGAATELLVFDARRRLWHREDGLDVRFTAWRRGLYALAFPEPGQRRGDLDYTATPFVMK